MKSLLITIVLFIQRKMDKLYNALVLKSKGVSYKSFPSINGRIYVTGRGKIALGNAVAINSSRNSNPIGGDIKTTLATKENALLTIGDNTGLSNVTIVCHDSVEIGNHVKLGGSVKIYDTDFHSLDYELRKNSKTDIALTARVQIGNNSFIGAHSIILKGVCIGESCIIGAGSIVTKNIPDFEIWAGNPAKFIRAINH